MTNGQIIFYGGILSCSGYIVYMIAMQISKSKSRKTAINQAQKQYNLAQLEKTTTKEKLLNSIAKVYGQEKADKVKSGTIWMGMPMHLLIVAMGKANDIKERLYKGTKVEKWYYGEYQTRLGTDKYQLEITLENDEVVGWKDLD